MKSRYSFYLLLIFVSFLSIHVYSQEKEEELFSEKTFSGIEFRSVGPSFMSGRIADVVIHPHNENIWYVAVGSGGVWKTENSGTTFKPIFDDQTSYSIGCVSMVKPGS